VRQPNSEAKAPFIGGPIGIVEPSKGIAWMVSGALVASNVALTRGGRESLSMHSCGLGSPNRRRLERECRDLLVAR